jgi:chromosome segregation ATPase
MGLAQAEQGVETAREVTAAAADRLRAAVKSHDDKIQEQNLKRAEAEDLKRRSDVAYQEVGYMEPEIHILSQSRTNAEQDVRNVESAIVNAEAAVTTARIPVDSLNERIRSIQAEIDALTAT